MRIEGSRLAERLTDVTLAGTLRAGLLEGELDRVAVTVQELRRDSDTLTDSLDSVEMAAADARAAAFNAGVSARQADAAAAAAVPLGITRQQLASLPLRLPADPRRGFTTLGDPGEGAIYVSGDIASGPLPLQAEGFYWNLVCPGDVEAAISASARGATTPPR